ncbi:MAG TPA: C-type lectin domain-containing protein, partial [Nautiliaceae bacterium]|nr:C-type lectin domain-containing protein [Nautiliaceae bacterium]
MYKILFILFFLTILHSYSFISKENNKIFINLSSNFGEINNNSFLFNNKSKIVFYIDSPENKESVISLKNYFGKNVVFEDERGNLLNFCFLFNESCGYCPKPWVEYNGKCYLVGELENEKSKKKWKNAKEYCESLNATLVVVNDINESKFLVYLFNKTTKLNPSWSNTFWVGLFQGENSAEPNSNWIWLKESSWFYWSNGEPNNKNSRENCAELYHPQNPGPFTLNDRNCNNFQYFICERDPFYSNKVLVKTNLKESYLVREGQGLKIKDYLNFSINKILENFTLSFWFKGKGVIKFDEDFRINFDQNLINISLSGNFYLVKFPNFLIEVFNPNNYDLTDYQLKIDISKIRQLGIQNIEIIDKNGNKVKFCYEQANGECNTNPTNII